MYSIFKETKMISIYILFISTLFSGTLTGVVKYQGKPPRAKAIKMDADPICSSAHRDKVYAESFILNKEGQLANVMVYLKNVSYEGDVSEEPVVIDQKGCIYIPHVFGIMKDQKLKIKNSDPTMHNIHSMAKVNKQFNFAMPKVVKEKTVSFNKVEDPFYIKCDVHPWMKSYTSVFDHPYFAVTDSNGNYSIKNIPPGKYEVEFWHEKAKGMGGLGKYEVTIGEKESSLNHTFVRPEKKK